MSKDHILFIVATLLIAAHVIDATLQMNESLYFTASLFIFPYVLISIVWPKLSDKVRFAVTVIGLLLELNHAVTVTIPEFVKVGLDRSTFDGILYLPAVAILAILAWRLAFRLHRTKG
ncbi:MAG: hypothetical protein ACQEXQ_02775 [Bacillota bacterium]